MTDRVIHAFFPGRHIPRRPAVAWLIAILLAPVALVLAVVLHPEAPEARMRSTEIGRTAAVTIARRFASMRGLTTEGWDDLVRVESDPDLDRYLRERPASAGRLIRQIVPPDTVVVNLFSPKREGRLSLLLAKDGRILGYQIRRQAGIPGVKSTGPADEIARKVLAARFGPAPPFPFGKPEVSTTNRQGGSSTQQFRWRTSARDLPDVEVTQTVEVRDGVVIADLTTASLPRDYRRTHRPHGGLRTALAWFFALYVAALVVAILVRYIQRMLQKEISHWRTVAIALASSTTLLCYIFLSDQLTPAGPDSPVSPGVIRAVSAVLYLILGSIIGISYSASEGDLREYYPGKLTALDSVLTGLLFSRNAAASIVIGCVVGAWMLCVCNLLLNAFHLWRPDESAQAMGLFIYSRAPLLMLLLSVPLGAIMESLTLLLPISILHRVSNRRRLIFLLLIPLALLSSVAFTMFQAAQQEVPLAAVLLVSTVKTAGLLIAFFVYDLLACVVALGTFIFFNLALALYTSVRYQETPVLICLGLLTLFVLLEVWFVFKGRMVRDAEVGPRYAGRLAERLSLESELAAAREAQLRLLPLTPPKIEGLAIAATCSVADQVGGDFYDFFRLSPTRLGLLVSDGGGRGLATALTIALAKGYLMQKALAGLSPLKTLKALLSTLGSVMQEDSTSGLCYAVIDTQAGTVEYARTGVSPCVLFETAARETLAGSIYSASATLTEGMRLVFYTDGIGTRIGRGNRGATDRWIQQILAWNRTAQAPEISDAILREVFSSIRRGGNRKLDDDVTLVVLSAVSRAHAVEHVA